MKAKRKLQLENLSVHNSGGFKTAQLFNGDIPEQYYILPTDSHKRIMQKMHNYRSWCWRRDIEFHPLPGMPEPKRRFGLSKDDPIPESYYILPTDTEAQIHCKKTCFQDWCRRRGIEYHPLPGMDKKSKPQPKPQPQPKEIYDLSKPRWHDTCTTYQDTAERLAELVKMRDNCHEHTKWQELQSQINALRVKMQSWCNEKADRHYSIAMKETQPFC